MISHLSIIRYYARGVKKLQQKLLDSLPEQIMPEGFDKQKIKQKLKQLQKQSEQKKKSSNIDTRSQFNKSIKKQNTSFPNADKKKVDEENQKKIMQMLRLGRSQNDIKKAILKKSEFQRTKQHQNQIKIQIQGIFRDQNYDQQVQVIKASQQLILSNLSSKSKKPQIKIGSKTKEQMEKINRYKAEKLLNQLNQSQSIQQMHLNDQDFIAVRYTPQIIQKAKLYKNKQLALMKQLLGQGNQQRLTKEKYLRPFKDQAKNQQRKRQLKALRLSTLEQQTMLKQKKEREKKNRKMPQGLISFEDTQRIKQRGIKQFVQSQKITKQDQLILEQGKKDMKLASKMQDIFLQQYEQDDQIMKKYYQTDKQEIYKESSFGKQDLRVKNLTSRMLKMGIDVDLQQIREIDRDVLFDEKKFRQQEQAFQRAALKRQKKKLMKKQLKMIHQENLRADLDYDQPIQPGFKLKKENLMDEVKNPELEYQIAQNMLQKKKATMTEKDKKWDIHRIKTFSRIQAIIRNYFMTIKADSKEPMLNQIEINAIEHNEALTVIHIFWSFNSRSSRNIKYDPMTQITAKQQDMNQKQMTEQQLKIAPKIQEYLQKKGSFLGGKITQILGLRYAPEVRFYYDQILQKAQEMLKDMIKHKKQIVQSQLEDYRKKGLFKTQEDEVIYRKKLETIADQRLKDFNSRRSILSKGFKKQLKNLNQKLEQKNNFQSKNSAKKSNKDIQSKRKKRQKHSNDEDEDKQQTLQEFTSKMAKTKASTSQKFWQLLDKY